MKYRNQFSQWRRHWIYTYLTIFIYNKLRYGYMYVCEHTLYSITYNVNSYRYHLSCCTTNTWRQMNMTSNKKHSMSKVLSHLSGESYHILVWKHLCRPNIHQSGLSGFHSRFVDASDPFGIWGCSKYCWKCVSKNRLMERLNCTHEPSTLCSHINFQLCNRSDRTD